MLPSPRVGGALSGALVWIIAEARGGVNAMIHVEGTMRFFRDPRVPSLRVRELHRASRHVGAKIAFEVVSHLEDILARLIEERFKAVPTVYPRIRLNISRETQPSYVTKALAWYEGIFPRGVAKLGVNDEKCSSLRIVNREIFAVWNLHRQH